MHLQVVMREIHAFWAFRTLSESNPVRVVEIVGADPDLLTLSSSDLIRTTKSPDLRKVYLVPI